MRTDVKIVLASGLAILSFVILAVAILNTADDDAPADVTSGPTTTDEGLSGVDETDQTAVAGPTVTSAAEPTDAPIVIDFPSQPGLGFEHVRRWSYDPTTGRLTNDIEFTTDLDEVQIAYTEVLPAELATAGDPAFAVAPESRAEGGEGTVKFRFELDATADAPATLSWTSDLDPGLTRPEIDALVDARDVAEFTSLAGGN